MGKHMPSMHPLVGEHAMPHPPQFAESLVGSTHRAPIGVGQITLGIPHATVHAPLTQAGTLHSSSVAGQSLAAVQGPLPLLLDAEPSVSSPLQLNPTTPKVETMDARDAADTSEARRWTLVFCILRNIAEGTAGFVEKNEAERAYSV